MNEVIRSIDAFNMKQKIALILMAGLGVGALGSGCTHKEPEVAPAPAQPAPSVSLPIDKDPVAEAKKLAGDLEFPRIISKKAKFSIRFPVLPASHVLPLSGELAGLNTYVFQAKSNEITYLVFAVPRKKSEAISKASQILESEVKLSLKNTGETLVGKRPIKLASAPGLKFESGFPNTSMQAWHRYYFTPQWSYRLVAGGDAKGLKREAKRIDRFFQSFIILGK